MTEANTSQLFPLPKRACSHCAFRVRIGQEEGRELFADYPFSDPERPMPCHYDGSEFNPAASEHRCVGFHRQARRLGYWEAS